MDRQRTMEALSRWRLHVVAAAVVGLPVLAFLVLQLAFARSGSSTFDSDGIDGTAAVEQCSRLPTIGLGSATTAAPPSTSGSDA